MSTSTPAETAGCGLVARGLTDPVAEQLIAYCRRHAPVHRMGERNWIVSGLSEGAETLGRHDLVHDERSGPAFTPAPEGFWSQQAREFFVLRDEPDHLALRQGVAPAFTPTQLRAIEYRLAEIVNRHVAAARRAERESGTVDLVPMSCRITIEAICAFLDLGPAAADAIADWTSALADEVRDSPVPTTMTAGTADVHAARMYDLVDSIIDDERHFLSSRTSTSFKGLADGGGLSRDELRSILAFLVIGGHETPANLMNSFLLQLLVDRQLQQMLIDAPATIEPAVDEALRLYTPAQALVRYALDDVTVGDQRVEAGSRITVLVPAANRDQRVFPDADEFRTDRGRSLHITFSRGAYRCLGKHLTRMSTRYVAQATLPWMSSSRLVVRNEITWAPRLSSRGLVSLVVGTAD